MLVDAGSAHAQSTLGVIGGIRRGAFSVADDLGLGVSWGVEGAWQARNGERFGVALATNVLWTYFGSEASVPIAATVETLELSGIVRFRIAPSLKARRFVVVGVGGSFVRAAHGLPPRGFDSYIGPLGEVGYQMPLFVDELQLYALVRLGPMIKAPTTASAMLTLSVTL